MLNCQRVPPSKLWTHFICNLGTSWFCPKVGPFPKPCTKWTCCACSKLFQIIFSCTSNPFHAPALPTWGHFNKPNSEHQVPFGNSRQPLKVPHFQLIYLFKIVICHSHVSLLKGNLPGRLLWITSCFIQRSVFLATICKEFRNCVDYGQSARPNTSNHLKLPCFWNKIRRKCMCFLPCLPTQSNKSIALKSA